MYCRKMLYLQLRVIEILINMYKFTHSCDNDIKQCTCMHDNKIINTNLILNKNYIRYFETFAIYAYNYMYLE